MVNVILGYMLSILDKFESGRVFVFEQIRPHFTYYDIIKDSVDNLEHHFKKYNPFTLLFAFFLFLFLFIWVLKRIKRIWKNISIEIINF